MRTLSLLIILLFAGCVYEVPLTTTPKQALDKGLLGAWETTENDGKTLTMVVLPWGNDELLVHYPVHPKEGLYFRAMAAEAGASPLVQLQCLGSAAGETPDGPRVYHFASWRLNGDQLTVRLINPEVVGGDAKTTADLTRLIAERRDHPDLFQDPAVFRRVKP